MIFIARPGGALMEPRADVCASLRRSRAKLVDRRQGAQGFPACLGTAHSPAMVPPPCLPGSHRSSRSLNPCAIVDTVKPARERTSRTTGRSRHCAPRLWRGLASSRLSRSRGHGTLLASGKPPEWAGWTSDVSGREASGAMSAAGGTIDVDRSTRTECGFWSEGRPRTAIWWIGVPSPGVCSASARPHTVPRRAGHALHASPSIAPRRIQGHGSRSTKHALR